MRPNYGAIPGFKDRTVLEYSQTIDQNGLRADEGLEMPEVFQGLVSALANHQTLLGDAIATEDPRVLFDALYAYPVKQDTKESKALYLELLKINGDELTPSFQQAADYLKY